MSRSVNKAIAASLLTDLYLERKLSIPQIARILNIARTAVRTALLKAGIERRSKGDGVRLRVDAIRESSRRRVYRCSPETREKISLKRLEWSKKHARGVRVNPRGYMEHTVGPHKGRAVHAIIAEIQILGRPLTPDGLHMQHYTQPKTI